MQEATTNTLELFDIVSIRKYKPEHIKIIKELLDAGADVNYKHEDVFSTETILTKVFNNWNEELRFEVVKLMVNYGVDLNYEYDGKFHIQEAVETEDIELIKFLVAHGAKNGMDYALKKAITKDYYDIVQFFIDQKVDLNQFKPNGESYLVYCCEAYHYLSSKEKEIVPGIQIAKLLLENGANINSAENSHFPLDRAISEDFIEMVELLFESGVNIPQKCTDEYFMNRVHSVKMAKLLVSKGFKTSFEGFDSDSPNALFYHIDCLSNKNEELIRYFIGTGIDLYALNSKGLTAFHEGISGTSIKFIEFLLQFYDFEKCNSIKPLLDVLDPDYDGKTINYVKEKLGMEIQLTQTSIEALLTEHNKESCEILLEKISSIKKSLEEKSPALVSHLPDYKKFLYIEKLGKLYTKFENNTELWKQNNNTPLQALYMEFGGATTEPFDSYAMFYGYAECDDSVSLKKALFTTKGDLYLNEFFEGIDECYEKYNEYYEEIREFYTYSAFLIVNLIFGQFVKGKKFAELEIKSPFYLLGAEHDYDPFVIFKKA